MRGQYLYLLLEAGDVGGGRLQLLHGAAVVGAVPQQGDVIVGARRLETVAHPSEPRQHGSPATTASSRHNKED